MVSHTLPPSSRDRLLAAAAAEFAAKGFDGATVDRIALRAKINKAMIYYHFRSKAGLYRDILRDLFRSVAEAVAPVPLSGETPDDQIRRFVRAVADEAIATPHFPGIWLREMADGGRHLDEATLKTASAVLGVLARILARGRETGSMREAHPFVIHMGIVAPLLLHAATEPVRARFPHVLPGAAAAITRDEVIAHVEAATLAALAPDPGAARRRSARTARRRAQ
jgi:AcrR family transcriptional regulator